MTTRRIAGRRAQAQGAAFEALFLRATTHNAITTTRIPDGCKQLPGGKLRRQRTPFDWFLSHNGKSAIIDTKTINNKAFPHSLIEPHQASGMVRHEKDRTIAGYIVWLRATNTVIFIPASILCIAMQRTGSIDEKTENVTNLGTMEQMNLKALFQ